MWSYPDQCRDFPPPLSEVDSRICEAGLFCRCLPSILGSPGFLQGCVCLVDLSQAPQVAVQESLRVTSSYPSEPRLRAKALCYSCGEQLSMQTSGVV